MLNSENSPEPIPTMTASTSTLMPDDTTLPKTFSARNAVLFQRANGTSTKPASVVSLNSISVTKSCTASTKKLTMTTIHAKNSTTMGMIMGAPASMPTLASRPGCKKLPMLRVEPLAVRPSPANERNTMLAKVLKLPMM
ncbi:hypothetical protein DL770_011480 [Monosporascus sp. CRB-9-2]|nr:hypothetical protein DL770_011480 [Monosporascus sp. CRB-9-2]